MTTAWSLAERDFVLDDSEHGADTYDRTLRRKHANNEVVQSFEDNTTFYFVSERVAYALTLIHASLCEKYRL